MVVSEWCAIIFPSHHRPSTETKNKYMASINLIEAFQEFKDAENIDRPTLMRVVEDVFRTLLRKKIWLR